MDKILKTLFYILPFLFFFGYFTELDNVMRVTLLVLFVVELIYCLCDFNKHIVLLLFLVSFFTFLMGRTILPLFFPDDVYSEFFYQSANYKPSTEHHVMLSLFITLLFVFIAYKRGGQKLQSSLKPLFNPESARTRALAKYSLIMVLFTAPFALLYNAEKVWFVLNNGYQGFFMTFESSLPVFVRIPAATFEYLVFLYLATLPSKKKAIPIIILYFFVSVLNIVAGDRGECMLAVFVIIYYCFLRNRLYPGDKPWVSKKGILTLVIAAPFVMVLLFVVGYMRNDEEMRDDRTAVLLISGFLFQQSTSMNVVAASYEDFDKLPQGKLYSLGAITDYFRNNYVTRLLFGIKPYEIGSTELAKKGYSLDSALTYLEYPDFYFNGGGMGSSFVAEAWYDFGYLGIILYSLLYGLVLASIPKWNARSPWLSVIALVFLKYIMYAPRARATAFVAAAASVSFWPIAFLIYLACSTKSSK